MSKSKVSATTLAVIQIAMAAHAVNRGYYLSLGDDSIPLWDAAPEPQRLSIIAGVEMHLANPDTTPEQSHAAWLATKEAEGWTYAEVKDVEKKQHPCMLPYDQLPAQQKSKDHIFRAVVHALAAIELPAAPAIAPVVPVTVSVLPGHTPVRYIGHRPDWHDRLYGSGLHFVTDQVRAVPSELGRQLLQHPDVFAPAEVDDLPVVQGQAAAKADDTDALLEQGKKDKDDNSREQLNIQDLYDQIDRMDKDSLVNFANVHYRHELKKQANVENLRAQAKRLVDQFGAVAV